MLLLGIHGVGHDTSAALVKDGRVLKEEFPILSSGGMQSFAFNIRRPKFAE